MLKPKEIDVLNKPVEVDSSLHMSNQLRNCQRLHTGFILFLQHIAECSDPENKSNFDSANSSSESANVISGLGFFSTALNAKSGS